VLEVTVGLDNQGYGLGIGLGSWVRVRDQVRVK